MTEAEYCAVIVHKYTSDARDSLNTAYSYLRAQDDDIAHEMWELTDKLGKLADKLFERVDVA